MGEKKITMKQQKFAMAYAANGGNASAAAKEAGYKECGVQGHQNLRNPKIIKAIQSITGAETNAKIASIEESREFWTTVFRDGGQEMKDRLRASELLVKSQGGFLERVRHEGEDGRPIGVTVHYVNVSVGTRRDDAIDITDRTPILGE